MISFFSWAPFPLSYQCHVFFSFSFLRVVKRNVPRFLVLFIPQEKNWHSDQLQNLIEYTIKCFKYYNSVVDVSDNTDGIVKNP